MLQFIHGRSGRFSFILGLLLGAVFLGHAELAHAQTGPELLIKPWERDQIFEASAGATFYNETKTDNRSDDGKSRYADFTLSEYDSSGRIRFFPRDQNVRADPRLGYDVTYFDIDSADPKLPKKLTDQSIGIGMGIADWNGWLAGVTVGLGYASAGAFNDGNAYYGQADLLVGHKLDSSTDLGLVLDYDGNRSFMPDVPLPGIELTKTIDPTLLAVVGFPLCSVTWTPDKTRTFNRQLTIEGTFTIPDSLEGRIDYAMIDSAGMVGKIGLFLDYSDRTMPFYDNELAVGHYRIFFEQRRAEMGLNWSPKPLLNLTVAGGCAFDQQFRTGWDSNGYTRIAKPGDEIYVRAGVELKY